MDKWHNSLVLLLLSQGAPTFIAIRINKYYKRYLHALILTSHSTVAHFFPNTMEQTDFIFR